MAAEKNWQLPVFFSAGQFRQNGSVSPPSMCFCSSFYKDFCMPPGGAFKSSDDHPLY
jgi:hypothetical protein